MKGEKIMYYSIQLSMTAIAAQTVHYRELSASFHLCPPLHSHKNETVLSFNDQTDPIDTKLL